MNQVRKEYHKYIRRQSWLPKCLRCSKSSSSSGGTSSATGGSSSGKDGRGTSLYPPNTSNLNSHSDAAVSPHGTSVGTNVNNIIISNNLNNANVRPSPALVQVLNHHNNASTTNHNRLHNVASQGISTQPRSCFY